jgi:hypothetical protein
MKMIKPTFYILSIAWLMAAVVGCAIGSPNISDGRYTSPLNNFSRPVPQWIYGWQLDEGHGDFSGYVRFTGNMTGVYRGIGFLLLTPSEIESYDDPVWRNRAYSIHLHDYLLQEIFKSSTTKAVILHEEFLGQDEDRELFAVIEVPEGSNAWRASDGKRFDLRVALLTFKKLGTIYDLHFSISNMDGPGDDFSLDEKTLEHARDVLHRDKEIIEFR